MAHRTNGLADPLPVNNPDDEDQRRNAVTRLKKKLLPGTRVIFVIWLIIYICLLGVGSYGVKKCPVEKYIPMYLIATGVIGLLSKLLNCYREKLLPILDVSYILTCLYAVEIVLLIFGSYWVYKEYQPKYDPKQGNLYCDKTVYLLAFVYITILYAVTLCIVAGFLSFLVCIYFVKATEEAVGDPEAPREP
ncbi:hypothetical protein NQ315_004736 [Exocentrus adspersus]|uniref:Uncharacterized protein n=1 Tax=Exocentrus adspersus TaxID=1586481 RepID=A0AAV8W1P7_9CUCU|nr:hypothetical protein NQ315_004736 [Exocentrus adspersus]